MPCSLEDDRSFSHIEPWLPQGEQQVSLQGVETHPQRPKIRGWALLEQRKGCQLNPELREGRAGLGVRGQIPQGLEDFDLNPK